MGISSTPRYKRKCKLKMRYWNELDAEIDRTLEKLWLLCELEYEKRQPQIKVERLVELSKRVREAPKTRYNEWGLEK